MIGYGVVGIRGFAATWHRWIQGLEEQGLARVTAVAIRDEQVRASVEPDFASRGVSVFASADAMLQQGLDVVDVVGLPVGIPSHASMAVQAMEAGYDVLVEKPVATTIQDICSLAEAERRSGRWCAVAYQYLYSPVTRWVMDRLTDGKLGAIREARVATAWPRGRDGS